MNQTISETVDRWIEEETSIGRVSIIRKNSPWYGMSEDEIEDRREYIRCYLLRDLELLLMIPVAAPENDFWFSSHQEFLESAFNTWDFQKDRRPFDKYGYRVKKVLERAEDLALLHSCISQPEGRAWIKANFEAFIDNEFRDQLLSLVDRHNRTFDEESRLKLRYRIARLNRHILDCQKVWDRYSLWEESPSRAPAESTGNSQTSTSGQEEVFQHQ